MAFSWNENIETKKIIKSSYAVEIQDNIDSIYDNAANQSYDATAEASHDSGYNDGHYSDYENGFDSAHNSYHLGLVKTSRYGNEKSSEDTNDDGLEYGTYNLVYQGDVDNPY